MRVFLDILVLITLTVLEARVMAVAAEQIGLDYQFNRFTSD